MLAHQVEEQEHIQEIMDLRSVSPATEDYLVNQVYLSNYGPDDYTYRLILTDCYALAIQELAQLGIYLDDDSLFEDLYSMKYIYYFRKVFDGEYLSSLFRRNEELRRHIESAISAEEDEDLLTVVIELIHNYSQVPVEIDRVVTMTDRCHSSDGFLDHLKAVLSDSDVPVSSFTDFDKVMAYIQKILVGRENFSVAMDRIYQKMVHLDSKYMKQHINNYDLDKISFDQVKFYALFDTEDELPDVVKSLGMRYMDAHHKRVKHHIEYWLNRENIRPRDEDLAMLVAHHYDVPFNDRDLKSKVNEMIDSSNYFTDTEKATMAMMVSHICSLM